MPPCSYACKVLLVAPHLRVQAELELAPDQVGAIRLSCLVFARAFIVGRACSRNKQTNFVLQVASANEKQPT